MPDQGISDLLSAVRSLPPMPRGINRLLSLDQNADNYLEQVQGIVRADPALTAQVIKIANSALYGRQERVDSVETGILRIGVRACASALVAEHLRKSFQPDDERLTRLWVSSLFAGAFGQVLAQRRPELGIAPEMAYTYGLLHDVGRLVLMVMHREDAVEIESRSPHPILELPLMEREKLGFTHEVAGRLMSNSWRFPPNLCLVISGHHRHAGDAARKDPFVDRMIDLVNLGDFIFHAVQRSDGQDFQKPIREELEQPAAAELLGRLGIDVEQSLAVLDKALESFRAQAEAMRVRLPDLFAAFAE